MKTSTLVFVGLAVASVAVVAVVMRKPVAPGASGNPPAPGPNGVPGFNANTLQNILSSTAQITGALQGFFKTSQASFGGKDGSTPAPTNDTPVSYRDSYGHSYN